MGWVNEDAPGHEGYIALLVADGREASGTTRDGILLRRPDAEQVVPALHRAGRMVAQNDIYDVVPWDHVVGWRACCECGWQGTTWDRASVSLDGNDGYDEHVFLPDGTTTVDDAGYAQWQGHITATTGLREVTAAAQDVARARNRLDLAVEQARGAGQSWAAIGNAVGVSKQAAYERWS